jgi:outer membrane murein-binding lipoprotein Lpp
MATLGEIDILTRQYSDARDVLSTRVQKLNDTVERLRRRYLPGIRSGVHAAKEAEARLHAAIDESPELFKKPKTLVLHGIKVGFAKGKGKLIFANVEAVIKAIKRLFPDKTAQLIKTTEKPIRKSLSTLPVSDLKKLGIEVQDSSEQVTIAPVDGEVDKIVKALLGEASDSETDED